MIMFLMETHSWKVTSKGSHGSPLSRLKVIRNESEGLISPKGLRNSLFLEGKYSRSSSYDMVEGIGKNHHNVVIMCSFHMGVFFSSSKKYISYIRDLIIS